MVSQGITTSQKVPLSLSQVELQALLSQARSGGIHLQGSAHLVPAMPRDEWGVAHQACSATRPMLQGLGLGCKPGLPGLWGISMQQALQAVD